MNYRKKNLTHPSFCKDLLLYVYFFQPLQPKVKALKEAVPLINNNRSFKKNIYSINF